MANERILFITGKLAEPALRRVVSRLSSTAGFDYDIAVLGISVAALMHVDWLRRKLANVNVSEFDRILLPGWCQGNVDALSNAFGKPFERGPKNLYELPEYLGSTETTTVDLSRYDVEILAEINHAPRLSDAGILSTAENYSRNGADVIDLGCVPGERWQRVGEVTGMLIHEGFRVSIDSFDRVEVEAAVEAGAELVLSCNAGNRHWASQLDADLVAIPDDPHDLSTLEETIAVLVEERCRFRIDPVLEPMGFGFAASLARYFEVRNRWPEVEAMMGIGNLTELTEVDSAGVNVLLAGLCQELGIRSVLTTEVINWARSAVREFDIARRLVHHSVRNNVLPKHVDDSLVMLRDPRVHDIGEDGIQELARRITDPNFRILVDSGEIHVLNRDGYWHGTDPYDLFDRVAEQCGPFEPSHAFYLGYELSKARTALTLGKQYVQDEALRWGFLTVPEISAHERRRRERDAGTR